MKVEQPMNYSLNGKTAVVTGASSGIGRAIVLRFAKAGAQVALIARRKNRLEELRREIEKGGASALVVRADLAEPAQISRAFRVIRKEWKDPEILVNNAGTGCFGHLVDSKLEEYEATFNLNVRALYLATKEVLPSMIRNREGTIINISSIAGKIGIAGSVLYCASKFAVMGLSDALLEEVRGHNVRVCVICPGMVHTEFFGRPDVKGNRSDFIQPEDVAEAALLCALDTQTACVKEIVIRPRRPV